MIIINFKNYLYDKKSLALAEMIQKYLPKAAVAVSAVDIGYLSYYTKLQIYAQHVDFVEGKRATGFVLPEAVKAQDAVGTLLNHSEHRLEFNDLKKTVERAKKIGLKIILCAESLREAEEFKDLKPYAIAFEDPELVGSGKSITTYRSDDVEKFAENFSRSAIVPLCGAGINSAADVKKAFELGCMGVLIASAIANVPLKKAELLVKEIAKLKK